MTQSRRCFLLLICLFALANSLTAQFGAGARFQLLDAEHLEQWFADNGLSYPQQSVGLHLDYWLRARNVRLEVLPEIAYSAGLTSSGALASSRLNALSAGVNVDIYPFDFRGDCDCPTFSKQGTTFKRGFFVEASLFGDALFIDVDPIAEDGPQHSSTEYALRVGGGIGFDIGLSDLVTITPLISCHYRSPVEWSGLDEAVGQPLPGRKGDLLIAGGLRVLFRPDYIRRNRR